MLRVTMTRSPLNSQILGSPLQDFVLLRSRVTAHSRGCFAERLLKKLGGWIRAFVKTQVVDRHAGSLFRVLVVSPS